MALGASVTVAFHPPPRTVRSSRIGAEPVGDKPAVFVITRVAGAAARGGARIYTATSVLIASGLEPGDRVITAGVSTLRSGEPVIAGEVQP
jgi:hypothetical protein